MMLTDRMIGRVLAALAVLLWLPGLAWAQDFADHRGELFATQGTDFWVCFPQAFENNPASVHSCLMVVSERDCDVTITNDRIGFRQEMHVIGRNTPTNRVDTTNFIQLPWQVVAMFDSVDRSLCRGEYDEDMSRQPGWKPQSRSFHVTSTDTIALYQLLHEMYHSDAVNVLPTELLRDDYVVQSFPTDLDEHGQMVDIIATEDSTMVDIVFSDWDWMNRHPGDTFTVMLNRGQLYHIGNGRMSDKFHGQPYPLSDTIEAHGFMPRDILVRTTTIDLSGTRIRARGGKRIAVYESTKSRHGTVAAADDFLDTNIVSLEQDMPVRYAGREFFFPNMAVYHSKRVVLRFAGLVDGTVVTVTDCQRIADNSRTLRVDENGTEWFMLESGDGPVRVEATEPVMVKLFMVHDNWAVRHNRSMWEYFPMSQQTILPVEWWHSGPIDYYPCHWNDSEQNRYNPGYNLRVMARAGDARNLVIDYHPATRVMQEIDTSYSLGTIASNTDYQSLGAHLMEFAPQGFFYAWETAEPTFALAHRQVGGSFLYVNGRPADSIPADTTICMLGEVYFRSDFQRPADSVVWDFGDGVVLRYAYDDTAWKWQPHFFEDTGRITVRRIVTFRDEGAEGCISCKSVFTRKPDTMSVTFKVHHHFDTTIAVRQCEGSYTFHGTEYEVTGLYHDTTYWGTTGCDTMWHLDFVTCPHCSEVFDTIGIVQLPWEFNGVTFSSAREDYVFTFDVGDDCDSILHYYLAVIPGWGEPKPDSVFVLVPNVFTPTQESNNRFKVVGNEYIKQLEVTIFDRQGMRIAHFDGLTDDWDGTHNGEPCRSGTYVYTLRYIDVNIKGWQTRHGTVTLIR